VDNTAHEKYVIRKSRGCFSEERNEVYSDEWNILEENYVNDFGYRVRPTT
jgi:hypothetical protein